MDDPEITATNSDVRHGPSAIDHEQRRPGLCLLFCRDAPQTVSLPLVKNELQLGRGMAGLPPDPRISRCHARVSLEGGQFWVTDLGSQNGTWVDGQPVQPHVPTQVQRLVRVGDSLFGIFTDIRLLQEFAVRVESNRIAGPALQRLHKEAGLAACRGSALHISGESGTGKELLAKSFHLHGPASAAKFIPINCSAIPQGLAERLLFGSRRGAFSGADHDAEGYLQAASGGTLFLDEVGDLDLVIQAKLLRAIETKEVLPLGASRPQCIQVHVCSATNKSLVAQVAAGTFRDDLYYRIGRPQVTIPPLRDRIEEIPWLIELAVRPLTPKMTAHSSLVEACLLLPWPGNVRELLLEIASAAQAAQSTGSSRIESRHLAQGAGVRLPAAGASSKMEASACTGDNVAMGTPRRPVVPAPSKPAPAPHLDPAERGLLEAALRDHNGNVSAASRSLDMHRTHFRRLVTRHRLEPQHFTTNPSTSDPEDH